MPLLMVSGEASPLPPESDLRVEGGQAAGLIVRQGQLLAVTDLLGGQPAALYASVLGHPELVLSPHHTRVFSNSFMLRLGMRLVTNRRRPVMVLGVSAPHLKHDLLMPVVDPEAAGSERHRHTVAEAFRTLGVMPAKLADPVNLFLGIDVGLDGSLTPCGATSRPGDTVLFRVVRDLAVVVAAPPADPALWSRAQPGPIGVAVRNEVEAIRPRTAAAPG